MYKDNKLDGEALIITDPPVLTSTLYNPPLINRSITTSYIKQALGN